MYWKRPEGLSDCGGWRAGWVQEKDLRLQVGRKTWRIWLKIRAENQNILWKNQNTSFCIWLWGYFVHGGRDYPLTAGCPGQLTHYGVDFVLYLVWHPIKWNRFHKTIPLSSMLKWQLKSSQKKHQFDWFCNPNNPIWRLSSDSLSLM